LAYYKLLRCKRKPGNTAVRISLFLAAPSLVTDCALQGLAVWPPGLPGCDAGWAVARSALAVAIKSNACLGMAMP
jgi:hypothetical protein